MAAAVQDIKQDRQFKLLYAGVFLALFFSAFEVSLPGLPRGPERFTTSELATIFFLAVFTWTAWRTGVNLAPLRSLDVAVLAFLASNYVSAAFAVGKPDSLVFSLRLTGAALLYLGISRLPRRERSIKVASGAITASLLIVVAIGFLEGYVPWAPWSRLLSPFREGIVTFISYDNVRVSSTLSFPTILSAYIELAAPIAFAFGLWMTARKRCPAGRRALPVVTLAGAAIVMVVQISTYTRSSLVAMPVSLLSGAAIAFLFKLDRRVWVALAIVTVFFVAVLGAALFTSEKMALRLGLSQPQARLGAQYSLLGDVPAVGLNSLGAAVIRVKNTGAAIWNASGRDAVSLSWRWLSFPAGDELRQVPYLVTSLPRDVAPGEDVTLNSPFRTPARPGRYILVFDLFGANATWFSSEGVAGLPLPLEFAAGDLSRRFDVDLPPESFNAGNPGGYIVPPATGREELWRAAIKMWQSRPLFGIGPDQFKNHYSDYREGLKANDRLRTHNIYLEALANTGLVGLAAMVLLLAAAVRTQLNLVKDSSQTAVVRLFSLGLLVAMIAYLLHGFLDYFLWQTGVAIIFFTALGLTSWLDGVSRLAGE